MTLYAEDIKEARPPYVRFEIQVVEDREASRREGRFIGRDVHFAIITPVGSKDRIVRQAQEWLDYLRDQVRQERFSPKWYDAYCEMYERWKKGQETPVTGTPIKGWSVLSPAQQSNVIGADVLTVEDLAQANDEARRRIGMGSQELVNKAITWLKASKSLGTVTQENSGLSTKVKQLEADLAVKDALIRELRVENDLLVQKVQKEA